MQYAMARQEREKERDGTTRVTVAHQGCSFQNECLLLPQKETRRIALFLVPVFLQGLATGTAQAFSSETASCIRCRYPLCTTYCLCNSCPEYILMTPSTTSYSTLSASLEDGYWGLALSLLLYLSELIPSSQEGKSEPASETTPNALALPNGNSGQIVPRNRDGLAGANAGTHASHQKTCRNETSQRRRNERMSKRATRMEWKLHQKDHRKNGWAARDRDYERLCMTNTPLHTRRSDDDRM